MFRKILHFQIVACQLHGTNNHNWKTSSIETKAIANQWGGIVVKGTFDKPEHYYAYWDVENTDKMSGRFWTFSSTNWEEMKFTDTISHSHNKVEDDEVTISCHAMNAGLMVEAEDNQKHHRTGIIQLKKYQEKLTLNLEGGLIDEKTTWSNTKDCGTSDELPIPTKTGYILMDGVNNQEEQEQQEN